jgi:hypothetical protein
LAAVANHFGITANFYFFATLNLLGALLVCFTVKKTEPMRRTGRDLGPRLGKWPLPCLLLLRRTDGRCRGRPALGVPSRR